MRSETSVEIGIVTGVLLFIGIGADVVTTHAHAATAKALDVGVRGVT